MSMQLGQIMTHDSCGSRGASQRRRDKGKWEASTHTPQPCTCSQGGLQSSNYKYLLLVFLKSAYMEPSNRLNDPSVAM